MNESSDEKTPVERPRDQMLKLVTKGFYNELINYGVQKEEILRVASHLLDNLLAQEKKPEGIPQGKSGGLDCSSQDCTKNRQNCPVA